MNTYTNTVSLVPENIAIPVTYNVNMGVDRMKRPQNNEHYIEVKNKDEFKRLIKTGIYKSMVRDGLISERNLIRLLENERGCGK